MTSPVFQSLSFPLGEPLCFALTDGVLHEIGDGHSDFPPVPGVSRPTRRSWRFVFMHRLKTLSLWHLAWKGQQLGKVPYRVVRVGTSSDHVPVTAVAALVKLGRRFDSVFHTQWQTVIATKNCREARWSEHDIFSRPW